MGGSRSRQHVISSALRTIMGPYSQDGNGAVMCGLYGVDSYVVSFGSGSSGFKVKLERCSFRKKMDQNSVGWFEIKRVKPMVPIYSSGPHATCPHNFRCNFELTYIM
jgi:hypothetical protein